MIPIEIHNFIMKDDCLLTDILYTIIEQTNKLVAITDRIIFLRW